MSVIHKRSLLNNRTVRVVIVFSVTLALIFFSLPQTSLQALVSEPEPKISAVETAVRNSPDVTLAVASRKSDNTSWLSQPTFQPSWQKKIYIVDDQTSQYTVPRNKGREAMVYLTYIITHYDDLHNVSILIHANRYQWHNDDPDYDNQRLLSRLQTSHIQSQGYSNLRCVWVLGCPAEIRPLLDAAAAATTAAATTTTAASGENTAPKRTSEIYAQSFKALFPGVQVPGSRWHALLCSIRCLERCDTEQK